MTDWRREGAQQMPDPRHNSDHRVEKSDCTLVESYRYGEIVRFLVQDQADTIQSKHLRGKFYEEDELLALQPFLPQSGSYLDIGANVGNHTLFFTRTDPEATVAVVEPNAPATRLLKCNLALNNVTDRVDMSGLGWALSDRETTGAMNSIPRNLGGAYFTESADGSIRTTTADLLFPDGVFDFVKIDVEDMELQVLAGMSEIIRRCRPLIFLEVLQDQEQGFHDWRNENGYDIIETFHHPDMINYLIAAN